MSIDWSFKPKDLKRTIDDLEKKIEIKDVQNKQIEEEINILLYKIEDRRNKIKDIKSKLEYAEGELYELNEELEKLNSNILIVKREISELNNDILMKEGMIAKLDLVKANLEEKHHLKEDQILDLKDPKSEKLINMIKEVLFQKGFLSKNEFEDLKNRI
ncbi:MAG: hypothetical protein ACFE9T_05930 [Promethearchaeota archaeon]